MSSVSRATAAAAATVAATMPRRNDTVVLDQYCISMCAFIANERTRRNTAAGLKDARFASDRSSGDVDVQGVVGEMAFNRFFGLDDAPLHDTTPRTAAGETTFDGIVSVRLPTAGGAPGASRAYTIDVKTTIRPGVPIRVSAWKCRNPPNLYALQTIEFYDCFGNFIEHGRDGARSKATATATTTTLGGCNVNDGGGAEPLETLAYRAVVTFRGMTTSRKLLINDRLLPFMSSKYYTMQQRDLSDAAQVLN